MCVDMYEALHDRYNDASGIYTVTHVRFNAPSTDFWIDEFTITTSSKTQSKSSCGDYTNVGSHFLKR